MGVISLQCVCGLWSSENTSQQYKSVPVTHCCVTNAPKPGHLLLTAPRGDGLTQHPHEVEVKHQRGL